MAFLTVNGKQIIVASDSWFEVPNRTGEIDTESIDGFPISIEGARTRVWECKTTPVKPSSYESLRRWIDGEFQAWSFATGLSFSATGIRTTGGTQSFFTSGGRLAAADLAGYMQVASGSDWGIVAANKLYRYSGWAPTDGYTMTWWTYRTVAADGVPSNGWYFCAVVGAVAYTRGTANPGGVTQYRSSVSSPANDPAAGNYNFGYMSQVNTTSPYVALFGREFDNGSSAQNYNDVTLWPFQMTADEIAGLYHLQRAGGATSGGLSMHRTGPFVYIGGDCIDNAAPVLTRARVQRIDYMNARTADDTQHRNNNRILTLRFTEAPFSV
jgi:hypothetical protein